MRATWGDNFLPETENKFIINFHFDQKLIFYKFRSPCWTLPTSPPPTCPTLGSAMDCRGLRDDSRSVMGGVRVSNFKFFYSVFTESFEAKYSHVWEPFV